jgi:hypothetical protein
VQATTEMVALGTVLRRNGLPSFADHHHRRTVSQLEQGRALVAGDGDEDPQYSDLPTVCSSIFVGLFTTLLNLTAASIADVGAAPFSGTIF